jgi:hypothetical protein
MAEPARHRQAADEPPPMDSGGAVDRAYHFHRARRRARLERNRSVRRAGLRFRVFLLVLVAMTVALAVTIWREVERLFGL